MIDFNYFFRKNYTRHLKMISRIINNNDTAEDIVQEAYTRALRYQTSYKEDKSSVKTWFNTILFNTLRDYQKQYKQNLEDVGDVDKYYEEDRFSSINSHFAFLEKQIDRVRKSEHRKILFLFYILGYSAREISQVEGGVSVTNVTTVCNRFKKDMKNFYQVEI